VTSQGQGVLMYNCPDTAYLVRTSIMTSKGELESSLGSNYRFGALIARRPIRSQDTTHSLRRILIRRVNFKRGVKVPKSLAHRPPDFHINPH
jgi:hypothetical protein